VGLAGSSAGGVGGSGTTSSGEGGGTQGGGGQGHGSGGEPGGEQSGGGSPGGSGSGGQIGVNTGQAGAPGESSLGESGDKPGIKSPDLGRTSRPFDLVLACGPKGVAVHPGDYRVTKATMKAKDDLLVAQIRAIVRRREQADPEHAIHPSLRYVIEPGGRETYAMARTQVALTGLGWPSTTQVTGGDVFRLFSTDDW
jgi:hypothetical protein